MNIVLLQTKLRLEDIDQLLKEFPQYLFLSVSEATSHNLGPEHWSRVEIFFGDKLMKNEVMMAHQLRWVHTSSDDTNELCLEEIEKRGNILVSKMSTPNILQIGEFVMSGILAFSKNLFQWEKAAHFPGLVWDSKWRDTMWTLGDRHLLQIGLDKIGTEVTRQARKSGMQVWGCRERRSFHPNCHKTIAFKDLHSILPVSDIVVVALPKEKKYLHWFNKAKLSLMKQDSVLIVVGNSRVIEEQAIIELAEKQHFRGVLIDSSNATPIANSSPLWKADNVIVTPNIAQLPESRSEEAFQTFRYNLRQYVHGNIIDMHNVLTSTLKKISEQTSV